MTFSMPSASVGELRGHHVAVVALGQGQEDVGALGAGPPEDVLVGPVAADRRPAERGRQPVEGRRQAVDDEDVVAAPVVGVGERTRRPGRIRR